jgi:Zn-dependent M28 family amino/carboxypeptidase
VRALGRGQTRLESAPAPGGPVGAMPAAAARSLIGSAASLETGPGFRATLLPIRVSLEVTTRVQRYTSNNVIGRLRGSGTSGESVVYLGHWDHFGFCRPEGAPDRICNGAVDNASGIAMMIEIAGRLALGPRPQRDILFLATTSEEEGLLGAEYFVANPVVPLRSIVAAINMDTVAIHPAGEPVAVMGRGLPPLDAVIDATVTAMGRRLDSDDEAQALVRRQDGWRFTQAGVPAIMVGGSFSNMALVEAFLEGPAYHQPADQLGGAPLPLDGATEDANLLVALGRRLADPAVYNLPERVAE